MIENGHAGFGRGTLEKGRKAPRPRPTSAILDPAFGLGFIKICSYFPYPLKMWVNGHEWAKRQATGEGLAFTELANGFASYNRKLWMWVGVRSAAYPPGC